MPQVFTYRAGGLHADNIDLRALADHVGTPFYCYSATGLRQQLSAMQAAFAGSDPLIAYAMKANSNQAVIRLLGQAGAGADVVSLGEMERAIAAGIPAEKVVFSGVAKSAVEMARGLELGLYCFNLESEPELARLNRIAGQMGKIAPVSVRINPDIDAKTHAKISTGKAENKFGIPYARALDVYGEIAALPHVEAIGVDMHIGSQITDLEPFDNAFALLAELVTSLRHKSHDIRHIDIGGGLGIAYLPDDPVPSLQRYAEIVQRHMVPLDCRLVLEPGRWLTGNAGVLVTRVEYVKQGATHPFVMVDAGMNDLLRPTLYEAEHDIWPVRQAAAGVSNTRADIVGPICETGDYLARNRALPPLVEGDLLAVMGAGAYGAVMSGTYNSRPLIAEVLVEGDRYHVIRPRQTLDDLIGRDEVPDWLKS